MFAKLMRDPGFVVTASFFCVMVAYIAAGSLIA
jgi:hypothetical protein